MKGLPSADRGLSEPRLSEPSSSLDRDHRHIGHRELELLRIFMMQVWQVLHGGDMKIGRPKSSPSSTNEANFFSNSLFLDISAMKSTDFYK
jgi:hypothetical protein